jgi:hypothetical protein
MAKHVLFWMVSIATSSTTAMSSSPPITDFPLPGGPAWRGVVDASPYRVYGDMVEALLPVAIVCAVCLLCTAVWLLVAGAHLRSKGGHNA